METTVNVGNTLINPKKCYSCGKLFKLITGLTRHKNRKTPCLIREVSDVDRANPNRCVYCNKVFVQKQHLTRHLKTCKIKNGGINILGEKVRYEQQIRILQEQVTKLQQQADQDKKQIIGELAELKSAQKSLVAGNNNTINSNNTTNNNTNCNNTVNITLNHYMTPNIEHLSAIEANGSTVFANLFRERRVQTPIELVPLIWYNPAVPENNTIYLLNKNTGEVLVYDKSKWVLTSADTVSDKVRERVYAITTELAKMPAVQTTYDYDYIVGNLLRNQSDNNVRAGELGMIRDHYYNGRSVMPKPLIA